MQLVILGATPLGIALAHRAAGAGHDVWLVEREEKRAEAAARQLDARVIHADIADAGIAKDVELEEADAVVAVTEDDSDNLMAMVLASEADVSTRISVVNEEVHRRMFERLRVQVLEDPEAVLARHIYGLVIHPRARRFVPFSDDEAIFEVEVGSGSKLVGLSVQEIHDDDLLPGGMILLRVYSDGDKSSPKPDVRIEAGDRLLVLADGSVKDRDLDVFLG